MNTPTKTRQVYRTTVTHLGRYIISRAIYAPNRREAVRIALNWFWCKYRGSLGPADTAMTVNDPYDEVQYGPHFRCNDRMNKLLTKDVCERIILQSKGNLTIDCREGSKHHRPNSLRRVKRRRDFGRFIAPNVRRLNNGTLYYRITVRPQISNNGQRILIRKYRDIRLESRDLESALGEIHARKLHLLNKEQASRNMKARKLHVVAHVLGLISLPQAEEKKFFRIISKYDRYRPCKTRVV